MLTKNDEVPESELLMPFHFLDAFVNKLADDTLDPYLKIAHYKLTTVNIKKVI